MRATRRAGVLAMLAVTLALTMWQSLARPAEGFETDTVESPRLIKRAVLAG